MNTNNSVSISNIGAALVTESDGSSFERLPLQTQLFPYLQKASEGMTLREISNWLKTNHKVDLSPATISRALNSPELHLSRFAEAILPMIRRVALAVSTSPEALMFGYADQNDQLSKLEYIRSTFQPSCEGDADHQADLENLTEIWENLPKEGRGALECYLRPHLREQDEPAPDELDQDDEN
ncbi:MAG: hypothetical protein Q7Q71_07130 [Verrucomicrobiota bacterium JB023]|nr:hypothetical protein [Verrucomicrobiota bacterium JB023]